MEFKTILFYVFSTILVASAVCVVTTRNPVHAALCLVLSFFTSAAIWMLLMAEFLAIVLVLVYVGAVMVLFLFVVMMIDIDLNQLRQGFKGSMVVAIPVGVLIALEMAAVMLRGFLMPESAIPAATDHIGTTKALGIVLYTQYVYAFEIAAAILLVAIIAAVALTLRRRTDARYTDPVAAMKVRAADRLRIVKMQAESDRARNQGEGEAP